MDYKHISLIQEMANHKPFPKNLQDILDQNDYNNLGKLFNLANLRMLNPDKVTTPFDEIINLILLL